MSLNKAQPIDTEEEASRSYQSLNDINITTANSTDADLVSLPKKELPPAYIALLFSAWDVAWRDSSASTFYPLWMLLWFSENDTGQKKKQQQQ